jgi:hypothetical protein
MTNGKLDNRLLLVAAGLAAFSFAACNRRTLTAGAIKAAPDAAAPDGANDESGPLDAADADARGPDIDTSPDGQSLSGPCGKATCLIDLFRTCVPEGSCTAYGGGSPSAVFSSTCYANGVQVNSTASGTGTSMSDEWNVRRDDGICYEVKGYAPTGSRKTYTITGANGEEVATGIVSDQPGFVTVTCNGGEPTMVSSACLEPPVSPSTCGSGECPSGTGGVDAGPPDAADADARDPDIDASPDGQSLSELCGEATCLIDLFRTCVPEGSCAAQLGSTAAYGVCYANGVTVTFYRSGGYETTTTVERNGVLCYSIKNSAPPNDGAVDGYANSYVITDGNGNEVATGVSADNGGHVTVICTGGTPITVDKSCLWSVSNYSTCNLQSCPTSGTGGYDGGDAGGTGGTTGETDGGSGGAGGSTSTGGTTGGGAGGSTSTGTAATLRCTLPRGPDAEPGMTCQTYCDDLIVMCKSTPGVPANAAECVNNCMANFSEAQLCCRSAHLMNGTVMSTACQDALGIGACQ